MLVVYLGTGVVPAAAVAAPDVPAGARLTPGGAVGAGCRDLAVRPAADSQSIGYGFRRFIAEAPGPPLGRSRQCVLVVQVTAPPGWTYALRSMWLYGDVALGQEAESAVAVAMSTGVTPPVDIGAVTFAGTRTTHWAEYISPRDLVYAPGCGSTGRVSLALRSTVKAPRHRSARSTVAGALLAGYNFEWRSCGAADGGAR